ncbi:MAG TPA: trypsin-like serine protease, partial [Bacteroidales bacterium]
MRRFLSLSLLYLITVSVLGQKATIKVLQTRNSGLTAWQIIDDRNITAFPGNNYLQNDSVTFSLEPNKYYFLKISVAEINNPDTSLYSLILNGEPILFIKSDIGTGDHLFPFFTGIRSINEKITGGTNSVISDFPWQVYYISGNFRCGGSIINGNWIVTAAHCTFNDSNVPILASEMFVRVGLNNPANALEGKTYSVSQAIVNEGFNHSTLLNDIALLRLKDTINFLNATPINLISASDVNAGAIVPGVMSWVTGWGLTHVNPEVFPTSLQKVQLPIISNAQASTVWNTIPSTDIMAGFLNGNKDACNGDSGGPLVVPVSGEYKLAGIVSWGSQNCNTYGAYTRVSDFEKWILKNTGLAPVGDSIVCHGVQSSQYSIVAIPGAASYTWRLLPAGAGVITGNGRNASVLWNSAFTGKSTLVVSANINNKISDWYRLYVEVAPVTKLLNHSRDTIICAGQPVTLNVSAEGYNLIYKWRKNGQVVQSGSSAKYSIINTTINDSGDYSFEISGSCGSILTGVIKLTVYPVTKISFISPDVEVPFGSNVSLEVTADGHDLIYQWQKDGKLLANTNSPILVLQNVNATTIGIYKTTVTGTCGIDISDKVYVYVKKPNYSAEPEVFVWPTITNDEFTVALSNDTFYNVQIFNS